jgi:ribosomal protein S18 acetylase RimI-like enzyme
LVTLPYEQDGFGLFWPLPPPLEIRRTEDCDADGVLHCLSDAFAPFRPQYTDGAWEDTVLNPETLRKRMEEMIVLVAVDATQDVFGTIAYKIEATQAHIRGMAVVQSSQGSRVANLLLDRVETELIKAGCHSLTLNTTRPLKRAIRFYERNGFRRTGEVSQFYGMELIAYRKALS